MDIFKIQLAFDAFRTNGTGQFSEQVNMIDTFFSLIYQVEMKIAVFSVVTAIILLGISFVMKNKASDMAVNKLWAIRIILIAILLFGAGDIFKLVRDAAI